VVRRDRVVIHTSYKDKREAERRGDFLYYSGEVQVAINLTYKMCRSEQLLQV
jgi:hypothetical protein